VGTVQALCTTYASCILSLQACQSSRPLLSGIEKNIFKQRKQKQNTS
jgi:hypothetical protein